MNAIPPEVSVILPCYNGEPFLEEAVRSILNQTLHDIELIVVDDGSTDASAATLARIACEDQRLRVLRQPNAGIVAALNAGIAQARGRYVARMDADDISFPDRLRFQADYLDRNPQTVLVGGYAVSDQNPDGDTTRTTGGRHAETDLSVFPPKVAVSMHPLIMVRADTLRAIGGYRREYRHAEDYDLFIRASAVGRIDNPPVDMLFYRRHAGAISIANVEEQERSAVRAELDAIARSGGPVPPARYVDAYTCLRIFRRYRTVSTTQMVAMRGRVLASLLAITPRAVMSARFRRLPALIVVALLRSLRPV